VEIDILPVVLQVGYPCPDYGLEPVPLSTAPLDKRKEQMVTYTCNKIGTTFILKLKFSLETLEVLDMTSNNTE
jgi:hypothetical protein